MARFRVISDIHSECHRDRGAYFAQSLPEVPCDAVLVAGDVGDSETFPDFLRALCTRFDRTPVVYVPGNHEHYDSSIPEVREKLTFMAKVIPNLCYLDNTVVEIAGVRIFGATLWFPDDPLNNTYRRMMPDFRCIRDFDAHVYAENQRTRAALVAAQPQVVLTHHLPCYEVVAPQWKTSPINRFFVGGDSALVAASGARAWVFGHTHTHIDYVLDEVRMVANPHGYPHEPNVQFKDRLVIEV